MANKVPPEILSKIFGTHGIVQADLLSWLRVCQAWYEPAKEQLYRKIFLSDEWLDAVDIDDTATYCGPGDFGEKEKQEVEPAVTWAGARRGLGGPNLEASQVLQSPSSLLGESLTRHPGSRDYIKDLELRSALELGIIPACPSLRKLSIAIAFSMRRWQALHEMAESTVHAHKLSFLLPLLPHLEQLQLGGVTPDLAMNLLSLCPALKDLELRGNCWQSQYWCRFRYPVIPPLARLDLHGTGPMSHEALSKVICPVAHGLASLSVRVTHTVEIVEHGEVANDSTGFWTSFELPSVTHLEVVALDLPGVPWLLSTTKYLTTLDLRGFMEVPDVHEIMYNIPSTVTNLYLGFCVGSDEVQAKQGDVIVAEQFVSCLTDPTWLPHLRCVPQIWTAYVMDYVVREAYIDRIREPCRERDFHITEIVRASLFTVWNTG